MRKGSLIIPNPSRRHCYSFLVYLWRPAYFTFCSRSTSIHVAINSCCEAFVGHTFRSQYWAAKMAASARVKIWCSLWVQAGCCEPAV